MSVLTIPASDSIAVATDYVVATYIECQGDLLPDAQRVDIEDAYEHIFDPEHGCDWCQNKLAIVMP
jgi:hypothetical protein